jgi:hypothetical protein
MSRLIVTFVCVVLAGLLASVLSPADASSATIEVPVPACNGGPCSDGWYKGSVTVSWSIGCGSTTITNDTGGQAVVCSYTVGTVTVSNSVTVKKDSAPPSVEVQVARSPDSNGWYTKPVGVNISGGDGASGVAGCSGGGTYSGPDGGEITLSGTCTDNAGNSGSGSIRIKYDASPPAVTPAPSRPPDANGWYNHELQVAFNASDAGSGVKECSPAVAYKGPDADPAKLVGQCRDNAGHLSAPVTFEVRYDGTGPAKPKVTKLARAGVVQLAWTTSKDVVATEVVRAPGLTGKKAGPIFKGNGTKLVDRKTKAGTRYWYEVKLYDQAGNVASTTVNLKPIAGLYAPAEGAIVRGPPLVAWDAVKRARFYNVQLWLGRVKLLSTWPTTSKLRLPRTWKFEGKRRSLVDGRYKVFVWPAFGTPKSPDYGKLVGQVSFVVKKP